MRRPIRVYLLCPRELALVPICAAIEDVESLTCAGSARSLDEALGDLTGLEVDVVAIEAGDDPGTALAQLRGIAGAHPRLKLLPLGLPAPEEVLAFLEAGAGGYVLKSDPWSRVVEAIEEVCRGEARCEPRMTALVCARIAELARRSAPLLVAGRRVAEPAELSAREAQVLRLLACGLQNKEISRRLGIALSTAAHHVQRILEKLGAHRRREAVRRACEQGLLDVRAPWRPGFVQESFGSINL